MIFTVHYLIFLFFPQITLEQHYDQAYITVSGAALLEDIFCSGQGIEFLCTLSIVLSFLQRDYNVQQSILSW